MARGLAAPIICVLGSVHCACRTEIPPQSTEPDWSDASLEVRMLPLKEFCPMRIDRRPSKDMQRIPCQPRFEEMVAALLAAVEPMTVEGHVIQPEPCFSMVVGECGQGRHYVSVSTGYVANRMYFDRDGVLMGAESADDTGNMYKYGPSLWCTYDNPIQLCSDERSR